MTTFHMPPHTRNAEGEERRVGFELEFAGLDLEGAAGAVEELFGGEITSEGPFRMHVVDTRVGDFVIEVDAALLQDRRYRDLLAEMDVGIDLAELEEPIEKMVGWLAELVVPFEVTTPPIALAELSCLEDLRVALAERKARGTGSSLRYAMGLHMNPEVPSPAADSILGHLQAFFALYEWLVESSEIDFTRRLTPFIDEFPRSYALLVLDPEYHPALDALAADYVEHNPTRNRPLDLLPLFVELLGPEVLAGVPDSEKTSPRPTFHYRLPNCRIDEPGWRVAEEWNRWVEVERLAASPDELARLCAETRSGDSVEGPGLWKRLKELALSALRGED